MDPELQTVDVFVSTGRFRSWAETRDYVEETYTEDGDGIPSQFMFDVGLAEYEPQSIESYVSEDGATVAVSNLLRGASYAEQWLSRVPSAVADAAICVFTPNRLAHPERSPLQYLGRFEYVVTYPEWFERLIGAHPRKT